MRVRRAHVRLVRDALQHGRVRFLLRTANRSLRLRFGRAPGPPLYATLAVTYRCNYRCSFCDLPDRAHGDPPLQTLIDRVELLRRRGVLALGITGGEPLLHPQLFELLAAARERGLLLHLNTNGSRLTEAQVEPLLAAGLHSLNLSLDGASAETHDALRGVPGSFEQIRATVAMLLAKRAGASPRLGLVMAVTPSNRGEVLPFARLARGWGADAAGFLPHHEFCEPRAPIDLETAEALTRDLEQAAREVPIVDNSAGYLAGIAPFLRGEPMPTRCTAGTSHLAVAPDGRSYPCVPLMTLERSGAPLAVLDGPGPRPSAADLEEVCRRCWWNCHRELDLSLRVIPAPARA